MAEKFRSNGIRLLNSIIESGLMAVIIFTPLAFGSVEAWSYSLMEAIICVVMICWLVKRILIIPIPTRPKKTGDGESMHFNRRAGNDISAHLLGNLLTGHRGLNLALMLLLAVLILQLIPLPPNWLKRISPKTFDIYRSTVPGYGMPEGSETTGKSYPLSSTLMEILNLGVNWQTKSYWRTISIEPYVSKTLLLQLLAYLGAAFVVINNFYFPNDIESERDATKQLLPYKTPPRRSRVERFDFKIPVGNLVNCLIIAGFIVSVIGILQMISGTQRIYWYKEVADASPFGPYVNRNHYSGYANMIVPLIVATLISRQRFSHLSFYRQAPFAIVVRHAIVSIDAWIRSNGFYVFALMLMISSSLSTQSRGGGMSLVCTLIFFFALYIFGCRSHRMGIPGIVTTLVLSGILAISLFWANIDPLLQRFSLFGSYMETTELDLRTRTYISSWKMIGDYPYVGVGLGGFEYIFFKYRDPETAKSIGDKFNRTHSDFIQLLAETGYIGFSLAILFLLIYFIYVFNQFIRLQDQTAKIYVVGGVSALTSMLLHNMVDFNMQIPANALLFFIVLGLALVICRAERESETYS